MSNGRGGSNEGQEIDLNEVSETLAHAEHISDEKRAEVADAIRLLRVQQASPSGSPLAVVNASRVNANIRGAGAFEKTASAEKLIRKAEQTVSDFLKSLEDDPESAPAAEGQEQTTQVMTIAPVQQHG